MSKLGTILRAVRSPASNSAAARGSPVMSATSQSPTSDWMKPLRIVSPGANEYCAYSVPFGPRTRTPVGVGCSNIFSPSPICGNSSSWRPSLTAERAIACRPVPWASALTHGGAPPSKLK